MVSVVNHLATIHASTATPYNICTGNLTIFFVCLFLSCGLKIITAYVTSPDSISELPGFPADNQSYRSTFEDSLNRHDSYNGLVIPNRRTLQRIVTSKDKKRLPSLSFHNVSYTIEQRSFIGRSSESHKILKGIRSVACVMLFHLVYHLKLSQQATN